MKIGKIWLILCVVTACTSKSDIDLSSIPLELDFKRLDLQMYACAQEIQSDSSLRLYESYREFFYADRAYYLEALGLAEMGVAEASLDTLLANTLVPLVADSSMQVLLDTLVAVFPPSYPFEEKLTPLLKRLIWHFSADSLRIPAFRTFANGYIPDGDGQSIDQIQVLPQFYGIGLHYFLGAEFNYYPTRIPVYIRNRFEPDYLEVIVATSIAEGMVPEVPPRSQPTLLDFVVRKGIVQHFIDQLLPETPDSLKLFYTSQQMEWVESYEPALFKEILPDFYSTDFTQHRKYLEEGPFSAHISQEAPPRIGQYLGWKIVKQFVSERPSQKLTELIERQDYATIFKDAKYRP